MSVMQDQTSPKSQNGDKNLLTYSVSGMFDFLVWVLGCWAQAVWVRGCLGPYLLVVSSRLFLFLSIKSFLLLFLSVSLFKCCKYKTLNSRTLYRTFFSNFFHPSLDFNNDLMMSHRTISIFRSRPPATCTIRTLFSFLRFFTPLKFEFSTWRFFRHLLPSRCSVPPPPRDRYACAAAAARCG
jgi:hypothetical protein